MENEFIKYEETANEALWEKEIEVRKSYLTDLLLKAKSIELINTYDSSTTYVVNKKNNLNQYDVHCFVNGGKFTSAINSLEEVVDRFAKTSFTPSNVDIDDSLDLLKLDYIEKQKLTDQLLKQRLSWLKEDSTEKEKHRLQKIIGRARNVIRKIGVNWISLKAVAKIENNKITFSNNADFARLVKSASRPWTEATIEQYIAKMDNIKEHIIVPENSIVPDAVYLTKYNDAVLFKSGKDIIFDAKYKMLKPDNQVQIGRIYTKDDATYIEPNFYLYNKEIRLPSDTFDELISNKVRSQREKEKDLVLYIKETYPEILDKLMSKKEKVKENIKEENKEER